MRQPSHTRYRQRPRQLTLQRFPLAPRSCTVAVSLWVERALPSGSGLPLLQHNILVDGPGNSDDVSLQRQAFESIFAGRGVIADAITPQPRVAVSHD